ncbi:Hypothetical_protein [Hexamita inflata]|uniref:Hypothetical_protein n=1 Tax=Hexamita inflata TaxID=28002 RepID=A0ABP1GDA6_9EUKA
MFVSFSVELSEKQNEDQEYIYINVTSTCNIVLRMVGAAVHKFDSQTFSLTNLVPESTFFVHKQVPGVNKRVYFDIDTQESFMVYFCSAPILMNVIWFNCGAAISSGQQHIEIDVDIKQYNYYKDYIYYSIQQKNDSNKLIKANIVDVYILDVNSHQKIDVKPNTPIHYQFAENIPQDAYFEVLNISPDVLLCFTDNFEYPENIQCKEQLNSTGKFNITKMNFLVQSQSSGSVEFQVNIQEIQKKKNNKWIIWVIVTVVLVVVGISIVIFYFFIKHKKLLQNKENESLVNEK